MIVYENPTYCPFCGNKFQLVDGEIIINSPLCMKCLISLNKNYGGQNEKR